MSTFLYKCAAWETIAQRKAWLRRFKGEPLQLLTEEHPAPDQMCDRAVEALADHVCADPESIGLSPAEGKVVRAILTAPPTTARKAVSDSLGYANPTSFSNTLRRAADRIAELDIITPTEPQKSKR